MAYLEVVVQNGSGGLIAVSANGKSLGKPNGLKGFLFGTIFPYYIDYLNALEFEGWKLISSESSQFVGVFDGFPIMNSNRVFLFSGYGRFEVEWVDDKWFFKGENERYFDDDSVEDEWIDDEWVDDQW